MPIRDRFADMNFDQLGSEFDTMKSFSNKLKNSSTDPFQDIKDVDYLSIK
jgi:hypothetical protein